MRILANFAYLVYTNLPQNDTNAVMLTQKLKLF